MRKYTRDAAQCRAGQRVQQVCQAYGLEHGPIHAELRLHRAEAWPIDETGSGSETGSRPEAEPRPGEAGDRHG